MIAIYIDNVLEKFQNEIKFAIDFIFRTLGYQYKLISKIEEIQSNDVLIYYGLIEPSSKEAFILAMDKIFFFIPCNLDFFQPGSISRQQFAERIREIKLDRAIPILCNNEITTPVVYFIDDRLYYGSFKFDLIGNVYFNLINYQKFSPGLEENEYHIPDEERILCDYTLVPYVNYYLWMLEQSILEAINQKNEYYLVKKEIWPQAQKAAVAISHTVSKLRKWNLKRILRSCYYDLLVFYKFKYILRNFVSKAKYILTNIEEYWNFDLIDTLEEKFNIHSTYFWGTDDSKKSDFQYNIDKNYIFKEISRIIDRGHEIALLAKCNSYKNDNFENQKKKIIQLSLREKTGLRIFGYKSDPYLTNELILKHNFAYDSSHKLQTMAGFPNGMALPYHLPMIDKHGNIKRTFARTNLEIPLICSDESFILSESNSLSFDNAAEIIAKIFDAVELVNGILTFDFAVHNFAELDYLQKLMRQVFEKIKTGNYYHDTFLNIAHWWQKRDAVEIREKKSSINLYFPESTECFTLSVFGNKKISHVDYTDSMIKESRITLFNISSDTEINVFLDKADSQ